jgi:hypothetical protein
MVLGAGWTLRQGVDGPPVGLVGLARPDMVRRPQRVSQGGPWLAQGPWPLSSGSPDGRKPRRAF